MRQPEAPNREVLAGLVERVTFHNADNGFCVLRIKARGHRDLVTVVGHAAMVSAGEWITASGEWINDRTHGQQFKARFMRTSEPSSIEGIEKYLGSGMIRGIGPVYAGKMVRAFGEKVFDIIEAEPERLREVTGIGRVRAKRITDAWAEQKVIREIMVFLHSHGVGTARAVRIYKTYGVDAVAWCEDNGVDYTSSACRAIPRCTALHTRSPTISGCAAPKPARTGCGASPRSPTPPGHAAASAGSSPGWRPPRAASTPATSSPRSAETPAISIKAQSPCPRSVDRRHADPRTSGRPLHAGLTRRGGHLCVAKQGKLDGDAGRLAMDRRNRANPPAAGRKTALNGKHPVFLSLPENFYNCLFAIDNQTPHYSSVRNPGKRTKTPISKLANLPAQPCPKHRRRRNRTRHQWKPPAGEN